MAGKSRRSQSQQAGADDDRDADEGQVGQGLQEVGGALQHYLYGKVITDCLHLVDRGQSKSAFTA